MAAHAPDGKQLNVYRYSGLGCMFAAAVVLFMAGGWLVDRWLGVTPVFTVLGALVGVALASVNLYQKLRLGDIHRGPGSQDRAE